MATTSFSKNPKADEAAVAAIDPRIDSYTSPNEEKAVAVRQEQPVAQPLVANDMAGFDMSDIKYPRINLIHKTSNEDMITKHGIGSFVLNKEVKLSDGKTPLDVIVLHSEKDFIQKLPYGDPEQPKSFKTTTEVFNAGGTLKYADSDGTNLFIPRANLLLLVAAPEGASDSDRALFPYEFNGKDYAAAIYTVSSSAYTSVGREVATLRTQNKVMRKGTIYGALQLTSEDRKDAKNQWKVPVIKFVGENSPEVVAFCQTLNPSA